MLIENVISKAQQEKIIEIFSAQEFPWYYNDYTYGEDATFNSGFQFINQIFSDNKVMSNLFELAVPIMDGFQEKTGIKIKSIFRIKANLLTTLVLSDDVVVNTWHKDIYENPGKKKYMSLVYYIITSDGNTVISNGNSYPPIQGNLACFDSEILHRATNPVINKRRMVINFVVEIE
jgi:hypothetical protein